jgi:hypothetical protein
MAIRELLETGIEQSCDLCGAQRLVADEEVVVATEGGGPNDNAVVTLPPCDVCGAVEYLVRTSAKDGEHPSPGSFAHLHRLLVDTLHARLARKGRSADGVGAEMAFAPDPAAEELDRWFKGPLRLRRESEAEAQPAVDARPPQ